MDTARLRQATQEDHSATESAVPLMSPNLTRAEYAGLLGRFYRIVRAWDLWADANAPQDLQGVVQGRRRAALLAADLQVFNAAVPADEEVPLQAMKESIPAGDPRAVFLGRMYVMEGSTLGGQLLARHVEEQLQLQPGEGDSYFQGYGEATGSRWKEFKQLLEALPEERAGDVIAAAKNMFRLFGDAMTG